MLDLESTRVKASARGFVSNVQLRVGSHFKAGQHALTLIDGTQFWIVANFRETNLEYMVPGQPAEISLKKYPGRLFKGRVRNLGWGVGQGQGVPSGELPRLNSARCGCTRPSTFRCGWSWTPPRRSRCRSA